MNLLQLVKFLARETGSYSPNDITTIEVVEDEHVQDLVHWVIDSNWEIENLTDLWRFRMREGSIEMEPDRNDYPMAEFLGDQYFKKVVPYTHPWHQSHIQAEDSRQHKIKFIPYRTWAGWYDTKIQTTTPARPTHFTVLPNEQVRFCPTPDKAYTLHFNYIRRALRMTEVDICEPAMPIDLRNVIIYWAIDRYATFDEAELRRRTNKEKLDEALMMLRNDQMPPLHFAAPQMRGNYGGY